ncbi:hypothetical protein [Streptantibioticus parmotrematis]|nr:hypothetical protein [Streptantibioticus parmotrematis]
MTGSGTRRGRVGMEDPFGPGAPGRQRPDKPAPVTEDQLITIAPFAPPVPQPPDRPWLGPLLIIGMPMAAAVLVFTILSLR